MYMLMYNIFFQEIVDLRSVRNFQNKLTKIVKTRAEQGDTNWRCSFQDCKDVVDYFYG